MLVGDFVLANNSKVTTLASSSFQRATGAFTLSHLPLLFNITLPKWYSTSTIIIDTVPMPQVVNTQTVLQNVTNLYITNTSLEGLFGLTLQSAQMSTVEIVGNQYLKDIAFGVGNITQQARVQDNGGGLLAMPSLAYAYNLAISNASTIDLPLLESVSQDLDVRWNSIQNFSAPKLSFVGGDLNLSNNAQMTEIYVEELVNVQGGLEIVNNALLNTISGLPLLSAVGGMLQLVGSFGR